MNRFDIAVPCHFGLEAVLKREIYDLGYDIKRVEDGRVTFEGDEQAICRANIGLRSAQRVMLVVGRGKCTTFDELFEFVKSLPWENYLPKNAKFWVKKASGIKSRLFSPSDIQSIAKKAMVERMKGAYGLVHFPEDGDEYPVRIFIYKDEALIALDTSGESLHKRGYRLQAGKAPISESLAAGLISLTPWKDDRILIDPFCGSGTIPIEAAMMAANIAPGMNRSFTSQRWTNFIDPILWKDAFEEAHDLINTDIKTNIQGYDIDGSVLDVARQNASRAGVSSLIHFQQRDVADLKSSKKYGFIITNPPYGERIGFDANLKALYKTFAEAMDGLDCWSTYLITSFEDAQDAIGKKATKNRKIYNGMIKTYFYQYIGEKPPRRKKHEER